MSAEGEGLITLHQTLALHHHWPTVRGEAPGVPLSLSLLLFLADHGERSSYKHHVEILDTLKHLERVFKIHKVNLCVRICMNHKHASQ